MGSRIVSPLFFTSKLVSKLSAIQKKSYLHISSLCMCGACVYMCVVCMCACMPCIPMSVHVDAIVDVGNHSLLPFCLTH